MSTIENNKLIAEFMGWKEQTDPIERFFGQWLSPDRCWYKTAPNFDSNWQAIMPVTKKCYDYATDDCENLIGDITHSLVDVDITELHKAVVELIKWYNKTKTQDT